MYKNVRAWSKLFSMMLFVLLSFILLAYCAEGGSDITVADDLLNTDDVNDVLSTLGREDVAWSFTSNFASHPLIHNDSNTSKGSFPPSHYWTTRFIPEDLTQGKLKRTWEKISQQVAVLFGVNKHDLNVVRAGAQISSRGDNVQPTSPCSAEAEGIHVVIIVIMVPKWDKNDYGEIVVYDESGEVMRSIHPFNGRVVMLPCGYNFVLKPPSINCKQRLRSLMIQVSTSSAMIQLTTKDQKAFMKDKYTLHSLQAMQKVPNNTHFLNVEEYITRQFKTSKGHPIIAFDKIIPFEIIDVLADTMTNGIYFDSPPGPDSSDNVQWILAFEDDHIVNSPLWPYVQAIVNYASKKEGYYPYDVSCNSIRSHDTTTVHLDCDPDQDEYTLLIYLNRNWTANDQGETLFFDYERKEMVYAIRPKYGRVAIFQGTIPHSARPPSPTIHDPRFTLAIKFAASKHEAFMKTMRLDSEPVQEYILKVDQEEKEKAETVLADLMAGKKSKFETEKIIREYEEKLKYL